MAKVSTVQAIRNYENRYAAEHGLSPEEARKEIYRTWEMKAFLGIWSEPNNEVIVPNNMPVPGVRLPGIIIS